MVMPVNEALAQTLRAGGGAIRSRDHHRLRHRIRYARERGDLVTLFRGVHAEARIAASFRVRVRALLLADPDAVLVGSSAAVFHGWRTPVPGEAVHATSQRVQGSRPGYVLTRRRVPVDDVSELTDPAHPDHASVRATSPALTTLDLALHDGGAAIDDALRRAAGRGDVLGTLARCLACQRGRRGNRTLRDLLHDSRDEPWSPAERSAHRSLRAARVRGWVANLALRDHSGRQRFVDLGLPHLRLAIEIDGWAHHHSQRSFVEDRLRDLDLRRLGWEVVRLPASWVLDAPEEFAAAVAALISQRAAQLAGRRRRRRTHTPLSAAAPGDAPTSGPSF